MTAEPQGLLARLRSLDAEASAAPWLHDGDGVLVFPTTFDAKGSHVVPSAELIVLLRNHVPEIIEAFDLNERLQERLADLEGLLAEVDACGVRHSNCGAFSRLETLTGCVCGVYELEERIDAALGRSDADE